MVEKQRQRVQEEMTKMVDELDKKFLRKMQGDMYRCAAKCCDNLEASLDKVQQCVDNCSLPLNDAQIYIQKEIEYLQDRLQRCVLRCNEDIREKMGTGTDPSATEVAKYTEMFEKCAVKCVDKHIESIPTVMTAMRTILSKSKQPSMKKTY